MRILIIVLLGIVLLPRVVSAAPQSSDWQLYCGDKEVSKEESVKCYLIAIITEENGVGIIGAKTGLDQIQNLEIVNNTDSALSTTTDQISGKYYPLGSTSEEIHQG